MAGVLRSDYLNAPPGSLIVVIAIAFFVASLPVAGLLQRRRRQVVIEITDPEPLPHEPTRPHADHVHGPGCGHEAIHHGDHVDYVHNGPRHAAHEGHYDEH